jgi:hypothetical protein
MRWYWGVWINFWRNFKGRALLSCCGKLLIDELSELIDDVKFIDVFESLLLFYLSYTLELIELILTKLLLFSSSYNLL